MFDVTLASLHHILVFSLAAIIATELAMTQPGMNAAQVLRVGEIDIAYGVVAGLILIVGFARVFASGAADYYFSNLAFDLKLGTFLVVGLLSIWPTLRIFKWRKHARKDAMFTPPLGEIRAVRNVIHVEAALFLLIPVFAAVMARGTG